MSLKYQGGYTGNRPAWSPTSQSGVWSLYDRFVTVERTAKDIAVQAGQTVEDFIDLPNPCLVLAVRLGRAGWIRFYDSPPRRLADQARLVTEDPPAGAGVHLEIRTSANNVVNTAPVAYFFNRDPIFPTSYPFRLTNESGEDDIRVEVTYYSLLSLA